MSIALATCIVLIITTAGLAVYYASVLGDKNHQISSLEADVASLNAETDALNATIQDLKNEIAQKNNLITQKNDEIIDLNNQITSLTSQLSELNSQIDDLTSQIASKPKIVVDGLTVEDDRSSFPYNLHIYGRIYNTGGRTAYNAFLHIVAFNAEGVAVDYYYYFAGITGGMSLGLDFRVNYTGSPIESWSIKPIWTDELVIPLNGTFPP